MKLEPSNGLSKHAQKLWAQPNRPFGKADRTEIGFNLKLHDFKANSSKFGKYIIKNNMPDHNGYFTVEAFLGKKMVGETTLRHFGDHIRALAEDEAQMTGGPGTHVSENYRRKGIACAMYMHAEKVTEKTIYPAINQTSDAIYLWDRINSMRESGAWKKKKAALKLNR